MKVKILIDYWPLSTCLFRKIFYLRSKFLLCIWHVHVMRF